MTQNCTSTSSHNTSTSSQNTKSSHNSHNKSSFMLHPAIVAIHTTYCMWPRLHGMASDVGSPMVWCMTSSWQFRLCGRERSLIVELWQPQLLDNIHCCVQAPKRRRDKVLQNSSIHTARGAGLQSRTHLAAWQWWMIPILQNSHSTTTMTAIWWSMRCSFWNLNPSQYRDYANLHNHAILQLLTSKAVCRMLSLPGSPTSIVKPLPISFIDLRTLPP
jgi:hypothetical protein